MADTVHIIQWVFDGTFACAAFMLADFVAAAVMIAVVAGSNDVLDDRLDEGLSS